MIGKRNIKNILRAFFQPRHYIALINMLRIYPRFSDNLWRYLTGRGHYPYDIQVRTPTGLVSIRLYSHHDLLTVNEIFCRNDYFADSSLRYAVDLGSNIGISALYFLTRNKESVCILYEPDPKNIEKLKQNLQGFEKRYTLFQAAVSDQAGQIEFGLEATGRYGGIGVKSEESIMVRCVHINEALENALRDSPFIDILKIDTEGVEIKTLNAISTELLPYISTVYMEAQPSKDLHPGLFDNKQYGEVRKLSRKSKP